MLSRHHIGQFSTPQKRYFASRFLAEPNRLFIVNEVGGEAAAPVPTPSGCAFPSRQQGLKARGTGAACGSITTPLSPDKERQSGEYMTGSSASAITIDELVERIKAGTRGPKFATFLDCESAAIEGTRPAHSLRTACVISDSEPDVARVNDLGRARRSPCRIDLQRLSAAPKFDPR